MAVHPPIVSPFVHGDSVTITITDLFDNSVVVNAAACVEIGSTGYYKYVPALTIDSNSYLFVMTNGTVAMDRIGTLGPILPGSLAAADVSGNLPAAVNEQANIDFGALQKQSLNAATPASIQNIPATGSGFTALGDTRLANLDASVSSRSTFAGGAVESVTDPVSLAVTPPTAAQVREEIDDHSTKLASIVAAVAHTGSSTYPATADPFLDPDGAPVEGISIECYSDSLRTVIVDIQETDVNGLFSFHLAPGTYYFRAIKVGYTIPDWSAVVV